MQIHIMDYLIENGITDCGTDCRGWFGLLHSHSGRWIDEEDFEWVWEGALQMTQSVQYVIEH